MLSDVAGLGQTHEPVLQRGGVHAEPEPCAVFSCHICRSALLSFSSKAVFIQDAPCGASLSGLVSQFLVFVSACELKAKVKINSVVFREMFG